MLNFAERFKEVLKVTSTKQIDLAQALGVTQGAVSNWVTELHLPDIETIKQIAEFLGCNAGWLAFGEGKMMCEGGQPPQNISQTVQHSPNTLE